MLASYKKIILSAALVAGSVSGYAQKLLFPEAPGIVSYTYRNQFAKDVPGTLDIVKGNGITDIEFSSLFKQNPEDLRRMCDERGIKISSYGVSYDDFTKKTDEVAHVAKILGAEYVRVSGIPHKGTFTLENAKQTVADFNQYGKILKKEHGLTFIYHNHGFEYVPYEDGTLYDYILKNTDPKYVSMEMDILWVFFPGFDPAALLAKYGKRYKALHLKDLKQGVARGSLSGGTDPNNDVVLGTGQIDIPAVMKAAKKAGVKHYYIEDESKDAITQVPQTIKYLNSLTK
ncbi:sugar phosphate isomerase/epimerase family protein [Mucilaginibacter myungsuensis]|uniref:Sugar phosphate isomerase/epimerase n=1 Tax=Mucilaginibacter myungsuensis TaxID=649104 RepID=A0A929KZ16_9SPHI|nr:sugar phosphate isomerase/epimerase [Mucilaginibacter myungsuensis]MBE9662558.1 sugar phosphate isomerase/epimerase [Mucilaginibacter myungsuensis]MDN3597978.1 sugar phosphate isomerase/epimerase [Mucilaginibacter myungsuensis]